MLGQSLISEQFMDKASKIYAFVGLQNKGDIIVCG